MDVSIKRSWFLASLVSAGLILVLTASCDEKSNPEAPDLLTCDCDTIPPASVSDLIVKPHTKRSLVPTWTTPGDDGSKGIAYAYDLRYATEPITEQNWDTAIEVVGEPAPKEAGQLESLPVTGLEPDTDYYFALKTLDEALNESGLSNTAKGRTSHDDSPPSVVVDLVAIAIDNTSFRLTWTAPGDDPNIGAADGYDIRYSTSPITEENWHSAIEIDGEPSPQPVGAAETINVLGLAASTDYFFALKAVDDQENWSEMSNVAPGLALDGFLLIYPTTIYQGESIVIVFRAPEGVPMKLTFSGWSGYECVDRALKTLADGIYPAGVYLLEYNFFNNSTGHYYTDNYPYWFSICWDQELKEKIRVNLWEPVGR